MVKFISYLLLYGLVVICASESKKPDVLKGHGYLRHLRPLAVEFIEYFQNVTLESLGLSDSRLASVDDTLCLEEMEALMSALSSSEYWALKSESHRFKESKQSYYILLYISDRFVGFHSLWIADREQL